MPKYRRTRSTTRTATLVVTAAALVTLLAPSAPVSAQRGVRSAEAPLVLDATTTILLGTDEAPALSAAVDDLASDLEKVLGRKPRIVRRAQDAGTSAIVVSQRSVIVA